LNLHSTTHILMRILELSFNYINNCSSDHAMDGTRKAKDKQCQGWHQGWLLLELHHSILNDHFLGKGRRTMPSDQKAQSIEQELSKQIAILEKIVTAIKLQEVLVSQRNAIREIEENIG